MSELQSAITDEQIKLTFELGWRTAANWVERDDLIADIGSGAYIADRDKAFAKYGLAGAAPAGVVEEPDNDIATLRERHAALPSVRWTSRKHHVEIPETEDWAAVYVDCMANKLIAPKVARYIAACNPVVIGKLLSAPPAAVAGGAEDLHNAILNIVCEPAANVGHWAPRAAYAQGHRDARHSAAELVSAALSAQPAAAAPQEQQSELQRLERDVIRAAQAWGNTDAEDELAGLAAEFELSNALTALAAVARGDQQPEGEML